MKSYRLIYVLVLLNFCMYMPMSFGFVEQSTIKQLNKIKSRLNVEVDELKKCVRRNQSCNPMRKKIYFTIATIGPLLLAAATGTAVYLVKQKKKVGTIPLVGDIKPESKEKKEVEEISILAEQENGSESQEEYFSAEKSDDEGFESAEDEPTQEEKLKKSISTYETTYSKQYNLLNSSIRVPHAGGRFIDDKKLKKNIQSRQREGELYYQQSLNATNLEERLNLLKKALDKLRGR